MGHQLPQLQLPSLMILKFWSPASICPRGGATFLTSEGLSFSSGTQSPRGLCPGLFSSALWPASGKRLVQWAIWASFPLLNSSLPKVPPRCNPAPTPQVALGALPSVFHSFSSHFPMSSKFLSPQDLPGLESPPRHSSRLCLQHKCILPPVAKHLATAHFLPLPVVNSTLHPDCISWSSRNKPRRCHPFWRAGLFPISSPRRRTVCGWTKITTKVKGVIAIY